MKIYAKQVPPEYQKSPFSTECWPGIIFHGNRHFISHTTPEFDAIYDRFDGKRILRALHIITGKRYDVATICGCCQSEWQRVYFPVDDYSRDAIAMLEAEYFNTGTEWIVHDENNAPDGPEDISGFSVYCTAWNDDGIKAEIADAAGGTPENVVLYEFTGWSRAAQYKES